MEPGKYNGPATPGARYIPMTSCRYCGGPIIFRCVRIDESGIKVKTNRPFPIHLSGPCIGR